jgi:type IV pilus assembly protein PilO
MNKMRQWSILAGVGVLTVFVAGWFLLVSPQRTHAADLRTQATTQQQANSSLQAQVSQLQQQKNGLPAQQRLLDQIAAKVPNSPALPVLIRQLTSAARGAGVELVSLAPSTPAPVTATGTTPVTPGAAAAGPAPLAQIPLTIQVQGSYFNIESFFREVEHLSRAMMVTEFTLNPVDNAGGGSAVTGGDAAASGGGGGGKLPPGTLNGQLKAIVFESPTVSAPQATTVAPPATAK